MVSTASTGTLLLVALVGGVGAFLGAGLGQAVQIYRDRWQYTKDVEAREKEAARALIVERAQRRQDGYLPMLVNLALLRRQLKDTLIMVSLYVSNRADAEEGARGWQNIAQSLADDTAKHGQALWEKTKKHREEMTVAHVHTMAIASPQVRSALAAVIDWDGLFFWDQLLHDGPVFGILGHGSRPLRPGNLRQLEEAIHEDLGELINLIDAADAVMLADLQLA